MNNIEENYYTPRDRGKWNAYWIHHPKINKSTCINLYRCKFILKKDIKITIKVSADERYELSLNNHLLGRGPERGDIGNWHYESYTLDLKSGENTFLSKVWSLGNMLSPPAQISLKHGFLLFTDSIIQNLINTGIALWETKSISGYKFISNEITWGAPPDQVFNSNVCTNNAIHTSFKKWIVATTGLQAEDYNNFADYALQGHQLKRSHLKIRTEKTNLNVNTRHIQKISHLNTTQIQVLEKNNLINELIKWNDLLNTGKEVIINRNKKIRIIIDLNNYYCAYLKINTSKGTNSSMVINWAESLYVNYRKNPIYVDKNNRDEIENKFFIGSGDKFIINGDENLQLNTLWWRAGRYIEVVIKTFDDPLIINKFELEESQHQMNVFSSFKTDNYNINKIWPILIRTVEMCRHETFVDCPYYEQLMYTGDSRLMSLINFCLTNDDYLPRKAILFFSISQLPNGFLRSQYPSKAIQIIPSFSLWWVSMLYDYALWRGDQVFLKRFMPCMRKIIDSFIDLLDSNDLIKQPNGWNFYDWVETWERGVPPNGETGKSCLINIHLLLTLSQVEKLEKWIGEKEFAIRIKNIQKKLLKSIIKNFWNDEAGLFSDDIARKSYSEHVQCIAILSGLLNKNMTKKIAKNLFKSNNLHKTTIYFSHYFLESCYVLNQPQEYFKRLKEVWYGLPKQGFKTTPERPNKTRSDCHGWGAHPLYHFFASNLGIRPISFGFKEIQIKPMFGDFNKLKSSLIHPFGSININLNSENNLLTGEIEIPNKVTCHLIWNDIKIKLNNGLNKIKI